MLTKEKSYQKFGFKVVGTVIQSITEGTLAANSNLKIGDTLVTINGKHVSSQEDVNKLLKSRDSVVLVVKRGG